MMNRLRGVGQQLGDLAARYAQAVDKRFGLSQPGAGNAKALQGLRSAVPIRDVFGQGQADTMQEKAMLAGIDAAVLGSNLVSRYALPVGAVTLAGKGLYDLTQMLNQQSSGTIAPQ